MTEKMKDFGLRTALYDESVDIAKALNGDPEARMRVEVCTPFTDMLKDFQRLSGEGFDKSHEEGKKVLDRQLDGLFAGLATMIVGMIYSLNPPEGGIEEVVVKMVMRKLEMEVKHYMEVTADIMPRLRAAAKLIAELEKREKGK